MFREKENTVMIEDAAPAATMLLANALRSAKVACLDDKDELARRMNALIDQEELSVLDAYSIDTSVRLMTGGEQELFTTSFGREVLRQKEKFQDNRMLSFFLIVDQMCVEIEPEGRDENLDTVYGKDIYPILHALAWDHYIAQSVHKTADMGAVALELMRAMDVYARTPSNSRKAIERCEQDIQGIIERDAKIGLFCIPADVVEALIRARHHDPLFSYLIKEPTLTLDDRAAAGEGL